MEYASLRRLVDEERAGWQQTIERIRQDEGTVTTRVEGSHVHITVRLRTWWALAMAWMPTERQMRRLDAWLLRTASIADLWLRVALIACILFLAIEIGSAFLPGGAVERVLGGGR
jgi:hypothetical protein